MKRILAFLSLCLILGCIDQNKDNLDNLVVEEFNDVLLQDDSLRSNVELVVLGTIQDAGSPQLGCQKECCKDLFQNPDPNRKVVSLGVIDYAKGENYMFEATPDFTYQMEMLNQLSGQDLSKTPSGIALTHAHIGHYTGLMYLGKEAMNSQQVPVYTMPKMTSFLSDNGPWSQLVLGENISLIGVEDGLTTKLNERIEITPLLVPHRDEYSETVGFLISGPNKVALFVPDIDKWEAWEKDIVTLVNQVDYAFLDATFFSGKELGNRDMSEIPHPSVMESIDKFAPYGDPIANKIYFIHFNHTNPLLNENSKAQEYVKSRGFNIATYGMTLPM